MHRGRTRSTWLGVRLDPEWSRIALVWWALLGGGWLALDAVVSGIGRGMVGPVADATTVVMELPLDAWQAAPRALVVALGLGWPWVLALRTDAKPFGSADGSVWCPAPSPWALRLAPVLVAWAALALWIGSRPLTTRGGVWLQPATCASIDTDPPWYLTERLRRRCEDHRAHNLAALGGAGLLGLCWLALAHRARRRRPVSELRLESERVVAQTSAGLVALAWNTLARVELRCDGHGPWARREVRLVGTDERELVIGADGNTPADLLALAGALQARIDPSHRPRG